MSLNIALYNAVSGLQLNQKALDVIAQNVANVNTEGYSRKVVSQESIILNGIGSGVRIAEISRNINDFMLKDMRAASSQLGTSNIQEEYYGRMQDLFGSLGSNSSLSALLADLGSRLQGLATAPEDVALQTEVGNQANLLAERIRTTAVDIQRLRLQADLEIQTAVTEVNADLNQILELNLRIAESLALGQPVADLQDQRDLAINRVSEQMGVEYFTRSTGEVVLFTSNGRSLVDRTVTPLSHTPASAYSAQLFYDGTGTAIDGIDLGSIDITTEITNGRIGGLIQMRDTALPDLYSQIEELTAALHDEINRLHNQGTAHPGLATMTGTRTIAAADTPVWTGSVRVAVLDANAAIVEYQDFDLSTYANVGAAVTAINGMTNLSASISANGNLVLAASGANRVAINEMTSAVTVGNRTLGASEFFGLNDFFTATADYDEYVSTYRSTSSTALGLTGTLTFAGSWGTTNVAYAVGDDLTAIAASINADATLAAQNIVASVIPDGSGFQLRINDGDNDNYFITDSSNLVSTLNLKNRNTEFAATIALRSDIRSDPSRISHGTITSAPAPAIGSNAIARGDNLQIQAIANKFDETLSFDSTGLLAASTRTLPDYAAQILGLNSTQARIVSDTKVAREFLFENLSNKTQSISGVNIDEEMANMIVLENAYAASARVITVTSELFDILADMVR
jgi:flagellar hook-associated protein 1 FlgK